MKNSTLFTVSWADVIGAATPVAIPQPVGTAERSRRYRLTPKGRAQKLQERTDAYLSRPFIFWDGEGLTTPDGIHRYVLLANSVGDVLVNEDGIPSKECFDMMLETASRNKGAIHVAFGAGYDINMMLSDWNESQIATLYKLGTIRRGAYRVSWRPGKSLHVKAGKTSVTLYDVMPFFQVSFDSACASYLGENYPHREMIQTNKAKRGEFRMEDLAEIIEYNAAELENGVTLMNELRDRLNKVGLRPNRWDGPGAVAAALFKREKVKDGLAPDRLANGEAQQASRFAYAGGRFEIIRWGSVAEMAYEYDLNSAYPSALRFVPCLAHGRWIHRGMSSMVPAGRFAVYHLRLSTGTIPQHRPAPLFCRLPDGSIVYPPRVEGWYWAPEAAAAQEYVNRFGGSFEILESWEWQSEPCDKPHPFAFIEPMFEERRALKKAGDGAHVGIKLGLNSLYGKTAQQVGWKEARGKFPVRIPPYHQLEWAGFTTSWCRAEVLRAAMQAIDDVIAFETDALFTRVPLDLTFGSGLGEWEVTEFSSLAYVQSGMWFGTTTEGKVIEKTRGVDRGTIHLADLHTAMGKRVARERVIPASLTRFNGAGIALAQDFDKWRRWERTTKDVSAGPVSGKRIHDQCRFCDDSPGDRIGVWHETYCPVFHARRSAEYPIAWLNPNPEMAELEELRTLNYEMGDSL